MLFFFSLARRDSPQTRQQLCSLVAAAREDSGELTADLPRKARNVGRVAVLGLARGAKLRQAGVEQPLHSGMEQPPTRTFTRTKPQG